MPAGFRTAVPPILGDPSPYGLLGGCTEVLPATDPHVLNGTDLLAMSCAQASTWFPCDATPGSPTPDNPESKTFDRPVTCSFEPITLYAGVTCSTFGITYAEAQVRALEQLRMGEQRALEDFFLRQWLCPNAVDLTPASGALHIAQGVGVLESWLAENYGGQGVLHVPAGAAALLSAAAVANFPAGDELPYTLMGNCIVLGAGYAANLGPDGMGGCTVAPSGEAWIYITPPVRIRRDEPALVITTEQQQVRTLTNDRFALAESTAVVEVACCEAAAVRVSLTVCP